MQAHARNARHAPDEDRRGGAPAAPPGGRNNDRADRRRRHQAVHQQLAALAHQPSLGQAKRVQEGRHADTVHRVYATLCVAHHTRGADSLLLRRPEHGALARARQLPADSQPLEHQYPPTASGGDRRHALRRRHGRDGDAPQQHVGTVRAPRAALHRAPHRGNEGAAVLELLKIPELPGKDFARQQDDQRLQGGADSDVHDNDDVQRAARARRVPAAQAPARRPPQERARPPQAREGQSRNQATKRRNQGKQPRILRPSYRVHGHLPHLRGGQEEHHLARAVQGERARGFDVRINGTDQGVQRSAHAHQQVESNPTGNRTARL